MPQIADRRATDLPLFSVIMPCYNARSTLRRAVESCWAQQERSLEIILVDDCSTDDTPALMATLAAESPADMPVCCHRMARNGGPSRARNHGWGVARGRYVAFLDADDCWDADKLSQVRDAMVPRPHALLLGHPHRAPGEARGETRGLPPVTRSFGQLLLRNIAQTSCVVVRRDVALRFDTRMRYAEDHDLWLRIARRGGVLYLPGQALTCLGRPQLSPGGLSGRRWAMRRGEMYLYLKAAASHPGVLLLLPFLIAFSLAKHVRNAVRLAGSPESGT